MPFTVNENRLIKLYRTNATIEGNDNSWRYCFSNIIKSANKAHSVDDKKIVDTNTLDSFNVNESINLLMEALPEFNSRNEYDYPIYDFISNLERFGGIAEAGSAAISIVKNLIGESDATKDSTTTSSFSPWAKNIPAWNGASNFNFEITFNFAMGQYGLWNAREEVFNPMINLIAPTLPQYLNGYSMSGPVPNKIGLLSNLINKGIDLVQGYSSAKNKDEYLQSNSYTNMVISSWDELKTSWNGASGWGKITTALTKGAETLGVILEALSLMTYEDYTYTIKFGRIMTIQKVMIKNSTWSFSTEVDQDGWPISGNVKLMFETAIPISLTSSGDHNMSVRFGS